MENSEIKQSFQRKANELTTFLYDKGFLDNRLARGAIEVLENYLAFEIQSMVESEVRGHLLQIKLRDSVAQSAVLTEMMAKQKNEEGAA